MTWLKRAYELTRHRGVRRYAFNTAWLFGEHFLRGVVGVVIGIYVTRYLGPAKFGIFSYIGSTVSILAAVGRLGFDNLLVRELVEKPDQNEGDLGTAFWLTIFSGAGLLFVLVLGMQIWDHLDQHTVYATIAGSILIFQSFSVVDSYFQARVQARTVTICRVLALLVSNSAKVIGVFCGAGLVYFFTVAAFEQALLALFYYFVARAGKFDPFLRHFSIGRAKELLRDSWPLVLTAIAITIYMKMDQVIIKIMLGEREVGIYSAAVRIFETWIALPHLLCISVLPALLFAQQKDRAIYRRRLVLLFRGIVWASLVVSILVFAFAKEIVFYSYGRAFSEASTVLGLVMFTSIWSGMGSVSARYFIMENMQSKIAVRTILAAVLNVILNIALIPILGILGSAWATLVCTFISNYGMDWFDTESSELLSIKHRAMFGGLGAMTRRRTWPD